MALLICLVGAIIGWPQKAHASNLPDAPVLTQTTTDTVTVVRNILDGAEITHFRVVETVGIDLFQNDGVTTLVAGDFITAAEGTAGLKFSELSSATETSLTIVAALAADANATGLATTTISLAAGVGNPVFEIRRESYRAWEGAELPIDNAGSTVPAVIFEIEKTGGGAGSWSVDVVVVQNTGDGDDAEADDGIPGNGQEDFRIPAPAVSTVVFSGAETRKGFYVELVDDSLAEANQRFTVRLENPQIVSGSDSPSIGTQDSAKIVIVDDETVTPDVTAIFPSAAPATTGEISITTQPGNANGLWRVVGESEWRISGSTTTGLAAGIYGIQFKPVPGFDEPNAITVDVVDGQTVSATGTYVSNANQETGNLLVNLTGPAEGRWRRVGETTWNVGGVTETGVIAKENFWVVEFKSVAGHATPTAQSVSIYDTETTAIAAEYLAESQFGEQPAVVPVNVARTSEPYLYVGQIQTPLGNGTGTVVSEKVVLTAAHVLFDDSTYAYQQNVKWRFQRYESNHEPPSVSPRGWHVFDGGYSAAFQSQRRVENTPGVSSLKAHDLDVAAMYFLENAGRGGKSGYLVSNGTDGIAPNGTNDWLTAAGKNRMLVGYPLDGIPVADHGKLHAAGPSNSWTFAHAFGKIFTTTDVQTYPGNSGGPLFVERTLGNADYFPAGIYVGGTGETRVRAIDNVVVDLIKRAEGGDVDGGGVNTGTPLDITLSPSSILENQPADTVVGQLNAVDPDTDDSHLFALVAGAGGDDNSLFEIVDGDLKSLVSFDFEEQPTRTVRVRTTDNGFNTFEKILVVGIGDDTGEDFDGDGLTQAEEASLGTNDLDPDFDNDGAGDGVEDVAGTDPTDSGNFPPGTVYSWGLNNFGQTDVQPLLTGVIDVTAKGNVTLALKSDGTVRVWGQNDQGATEAPVGLSDVVAVSSGQNFSVVLKSDGTVVAWGRNDEGQTVVPPGLEDVVWVSAGVQATYALKGDGALVSWGRNASGLLNVPPDFVDGIQIEAGSNHTTGLQIDGSVLGWGQNTFGELDVPVGLSGVTKVVVASAHNLALRSDGTVAAWGRNTSGQTSVPSGLSDVTRIASGSQACMALKSDRTLIGWGSSTGGVEDVPAGLNKVDRVAIGNHGVALRSEQGAPVISGSQLITGVVGTPFNYQITASGAPDQYSALSLPPGLTLNSATGEISGTPTEAGRHYSRLFAHSSQGRDDRLVFFALTSGTAPLDITLSPSSILENQPADTVVGQLNAVDPDTDDSHLFALVAGAGGDDNSLFEIVDGDLKSLVSFDFEEQPTRTVRVRTTDNGFNTFEKILVVGIGDDTGEDFDGDGLTQAEEASLGTNDLDPDFDNDGAGDGVEDVAGTDPTDSGNFPPGTVYSWGLNNFGQTDVQPLLTGVIDVTAKGNVTLALKSDGTVRVWGQNDQGATEAPVGLSDVVAVSSGQNFSVVLKSDGTVVAWGRNDEGQTVVPPGLEDVVWVSAGVQATYALKGDGALVSWGRNASGLLNVPPDFVDGIQIEAGSNHTTGLQIDGSVLGWGQNTFGELDVPVGLSGVTKVVVASAHNLALRSDGTVAAWGRNTSGQTSVPSGLSDVTRIASGSQACMALKSDRTLIGWGSSTGGVEDVPAGLNKVDRVAIGNHGVALRSEQGAPVISGSQLITGVVGTPFNYQITASGAPDQYSALSLPPGLTLNSATGEISGTPTEAGRHYSRLFAHSSQGRDDRLVFFALTSGTAPLDITLSPSSILENQPADTVVGQLNAVDPDTDDSHLFALVAGAGGDDNSLFEIVDGDLKSLVSFDFEEQPTRTVRVRTTDNGFNTFEKILVVGIGDDTGEDFDGDGLTQAEEASLGTNDLDPDFDNDGAGDGVEDVAGTDPTDSGNFPPGTVYSWGLNNFGQTDVQPLLTGVIDVTAKGNVTLALKSDGTVRVWGQNDQGATEAPVGLSDVVAVSSGQNFSVVLKSDGTVVAWGRNDEGQTVVPPGLEDVVWVSAGVQATYALKGDGALVSWGRNASGLLNVPPDFVDGIQIEAGSNHTTGLQIDGSVLGWGQNTFGELDVPVGLSGVTKVVVASAHNLALRSDGTVAAWGRNTSGQTSVPSGLSDVTRIASGSQACMALKSDRTLIGWGSSTGGVEDVPAGLNKVDRVAIGNHGVALRSEQGAPVISGSQLITGVVGTPFNYQITASGAPDQYSALSLPPGLTLNSATGEISGTPTEAGRHYSRLFAHSSQGRDDRLVFFALTSFFPHPPTLTRTSPTHFTITRNQQNNDKITHFRILEMRGVSLTLADGTTPVSSGDWITSTQATAGLQFTPLQGATIQTVTVASAVTDSEGGTGSATSTIDLNPTSGAATFSLDSASYQASEGDLLTITGSSVSALLVDILKTGDGGGSGQFSVDVELIPGTATPDDNDLGNGLEDYREPSVTTVTFNTSDAAKGFYIELVDDEVSEFEETFKVRLSNPTNGAVLGEITEATVTIIDDEKAVSELSIIAPDPVPSEVGTGSLQVILVPNVPGTGWRLLSESVWRDSSDAISGLEPGQYAVEFKPVVGFSAPLPITAKVEATEGGLPLVMFYPPDGSTLSTASIQVTLENNIGQWRLRGENANLWNSSGTTDSTLPGIYTLEFEHVDGFQAPLPRQIQLVPGETITFDENYTPESAFGNATPQPLTLADATTQSPHQFNGQITTNLGSASGVAVSEHVVLTAASALWDDHNFRYLTEVQWQFQKHGEEHNPRPLTPRGWQVIGQGYAAEFSRQRQVEDDPGNFSNRARELDIAAMYFLQPVARGGSGGYLVDNTSTNPWLTDAGRPRLMVGYPIGGAAGLVPGKMHATPAATTTNFTHVQGPVFTTTDFQDLPGMVGAPVYARHENGTSYPAAIILGGHGETFVRAIDNSVAFLIGQAEILGDTGQDGSGKGNNPYPQVTVERLTTGAVTVSANVNQSRWRLKNKTIDQQSPQFPSGFSYQSEPGDYDINFSEVQEWIKPEDEPLSLGEQEGASVFGEYAVMPDEDFNAATFAEFLAHYRETQSTGDGDGDSLDALTEYAFNLKGDRPDARVMESDTGTSGLPHISVVDNGDGQLRIRVEFLRKKDSALTYTVEFNNGLEGGNWGAVATPTGIDLGDDWERVIVEDTVTVSDQNARFARVRVTHNAP